MEFCERAWNKLNMASCYLQRVTIKTAKCTETAGLRLENSLDSDSAWSKMVNFAKITQF